MYINLQMFLCASSLSDYENVWLAITTVISICKHIITYLPAVYRQLRPKVHLLYRPRRRQGLCLWVGNPPSRVPLCSCTSRSWLHCTFKTRHFFQHFVLVHCQITSPSLLTAASFDVGNNDDTASRIICFLCCSSVIC
jgi:hypothetical protein